MAATAPHVNIGRVLDGAVLTEPAYLTSGGLVANFPDAALNVFHNKGYIFLRKHYGRGGFFFTTIRWLPCLRMIMPTGQRSRHRQSTPYCL